MMDVSPLFWKDKIPQEYLQIDFRCLMIIVIVIMFKVHIAVAINIIDINKLWLRIITVLDLQTPQPHNNNTALGYISSFKTRAQGNLFNMPDVI